MILRTAFCHQLPYCYTPLARAQIRTFEVGENLKSQVVGSALGGGGGVGETKPSTLPKPLGAVSRALDMVPNLL